MNILITSAGQRVSLVRAFQQELQRFYPDGKVFTVDMHPHLSAACQCADQAFKVKKVTDPAYIPELAALCRKHNIRMIIPTIDTELPVLAQHKSTFTGLGIDVIVSSLSFIQQCRDKRLIHHFFQQHNIEVPRLMNKNNPDFPLFIKPYDGSLSVDTYLVANSAALTDYHMSNEKFLFMEYLDKAEYNEYTVDMYFGRDHAVKCIVPRKRIAVRAGEVNKALTCRNLVVPFLKDNLGYIEGAAGCLTVQLFHSIQTGRIVGIEINARFGGGYPLSYRAGANFPRWLISEYYFNEEIKYAENWEDNLLMLRYDDEILVHDYKA